MSDSYATFETVLGSVYVAWNRQGVSAASRSASAAEFEDWFRKDVGRQVAPAEPPKDLAAKIEDELEGKRRMRFDLRGLTEFEQAVLRKTREIPPGEGRPYAWAARAIARPPAHPPTVPARRQVHNAVAAPARRRAVRWGGTWRESG